MNLLDRILPRRDERYADRLFESLASAHGLSRDDERLLLAIADSSKVVRAAEVFVRPSLFHRSPDRSRWSTKDVDRIAAKLFDRVPDRSSPSSAEESGTTEAAGSPDEGSSMDDTASSSSASRPETPSVAAPHRDRGARLIRWRPTRSKPSPESAPTPPAESSAPAEPARPTSDKPIELETIEDPPGFAPTLRE